MTEAPKPEPTKPKAKIAPETLAMRSPPPRVGRVSRPVLIGCAAVGLTGLSAIVLFALNPPSLRIVAPSETVSTDRDFVSEELSKLPPTYDGVRSAARPQTNIVSPLQRPAPETALTAQSEDAIRTARLAGQAREAPVLFRLQPIAPINQGTDATAKTTASPGQPAATETPSPLTALQATAGDTAPASTGDQLRNLSSPEEPVTVVAAWPVLVSICVVPAVASSIQTGLESDMLSAWKSALSLINSKPLSWLGVATKVAPTPIDIRSTFRITRLEMSPIP